MYINVVSKYRAHSKEFPKAQKTGSVREKKDGKYRIWNLYEYKDVKMCSLASTMTDKFEDIEKYRIVINIAKTLEFLHQAGMLFIDLSVDTVMVIIILALLVETSRANAITRWPSVNNSCYRISPKVIYHR